MAPKIPGAFFKIEKLEIGCKVRIWFPELMRLAQRCALQSIFEDKKMKLSIAYNFDPAVIPRLAEFPEVYEIYGKMTSDCIGGGRSSYTLPVIAKKDVRYSVELAHKHKITFNYLLNGAFLNGFEQTRSGQRKIRRLLDFLAKTGVDSLTVSSPYLLTLIKHLYPAFKVRVSVFAKIDSPGAARQWEDLGADTLCISAISCNRNFKSLKAIRKAVSCDLQLIANASCLSGCSYELAHMNMLTHSSKTKSKNGGFCFDYCFLHCSYKRLTDKVNYIKATWIRPEDLALYEKIGYSNFKIVERSSPSDLLVKRTAAYARRSFEGNLLELAGPVAKIKKEQNTPWIDRLRLILTMFRPFKIKIKSLLVLKEYVEKVIPHSYDRENSPVYINNGLLNSYLSDFIKKECNSSECQTCGFCEETASKTVTYQKANREEALALGSFLKKGLTDRSHWF